MGRLTDWLTGADINLKVAEVPKRAAAPLAFDDWVNYFSYQGLSYPFIQQTNPGQPTQEIGGDFRGLIEGAYKSSGVVFACMLARQMLFSEARFMFRKLEQGRPGELVGHDSYLGLLRRPWANGTTGDLLARMIQDADLAGNFYGTRQPGRIQRLRPDWVTIVMGSQMEPQHPGGALDMELVGYAYQPGGPGSGQDPIPLLPNEVCHFAPIPDPSAFYRGMSWLTPVVREIMGDQAATTHKLKFFENGAPQPLDAGVLTPGGWTTMGEVEVGDEVIGRDGRGHRVIATYPQGERDIYRVTFSDGASTECTEDHIWRVQSTYDRKKGTARTLTLGEIIRSGIAYDSGPLKWSVPHVDPVEYAPVESLDLDPYFLGLLLGDGSFRGNGRGSGGVSLSTAAEDADEIADAIGGVLPSGVRMSRRDRGGWSEFYFKGEGAPSPSPVTTLVKELDLWEVLGRDKVIPEPYLHASVSDRLAVLQGLIDADGHVERRQGNCVRLTTTSTQLAAQVAELVGSLGGTSSIAPTKGRRTWTVIIRRLPDWMVPCRLARKVAAYTPPRRVGRRRFIQSVEFVGRKQAKCISVGVRDSLYVTDDFILTHNTPNTVVSLDPGIDQESFEKWIEAFDSNLTEPYKTLYLGGGAKVEVVGSDLRQVDFRQVQGAGETRIAAAANVPPVIVGLSEGLQAATYSNYAQARRRFADGTMRPLWRNAAASLASITHVPTGFELWYDDRDISFLQDDMKDRAEIQATQAQALKALTEAGFTPDSAVAAVNADDLAKLKHSGLTSVQLLPPGQSTNGKNGTGDAPEPALLGEGGSND